MFEVFNARTGETLFWTRSEERALASATANRQGTGYYGLLLIDYTAYWLRADGEMAEALHAS